MSDVDSQYILFVKQKTAYEMRISDWSSDVCSSDLFDPLQQRRPWRHLFHLSQKLFALGALALAGVFGVAKGHLRHRWVSRWLLRYSTKIDLFRASLSRFLDRKRTRLHSSH